MEAGQKTGQDNVIPQWSLFPPAQNPKTSESFGKTSYHPAHIIGVTNGNVYERKLEFACGHAALATLIAENMPQLSQVFV